MLFSEYRIAQALFLQTQLQDDKVKRGQDAAQILFWYNNYLQICGVSNIEQLNTKLFEVMTKINPLFDKFNKETFSNINKIVDSIVSEHIKTNINN